MMKIKSGLLIVSVALTIAAVPAIAQQQVYTYECDNGKSFSAQLSGNSATVRVNNQTVTLPAVPAEPGQARYSDGRYVLFTTANNTEAFVEVDGDRTHAGCIAQDGTRRPAATAAPVRGLW